MSPHKSGVWVIEIQPARDSHHQLCKLRYTENAKLYCNTKFSDRSTNPGVTGAWQVGGRSDVGFGQRVELDVAYVLSRSFRADLRILFRTVPAVLGRKGSR